MLQPSRNLPEYDHHEAIFLERYTWLLGWALQLTKHDRQRAEDLVHDAYIQFTLTRPDLNAITNLNGYLYIMLRNLQRSHMRRALRTQHRTLSIIDYDSAEIGLRGIDPSEQLQVQESLRQVCQYACIRKRTSKAGSVLILRFLHGYYPREIAQVMRSTREAVEERLRTARNEARQYLVDPKALRFMREDVSETFKLSRMGLVSTIDELLNELRATIFNSRQGDCLKPRQLQDLYRGNETSRMDCMTLGHLVSCRQCLDEVNRTLNLPLLAERFATETVDSETGPKGGDGGSTGGAGGDGPSDSELLKCRRRTRDVLEHRPAELCISINGSLMAGQKISSELSEQSLTLNVIERIDFVEIFSEQDVRLLLLSLEDLPKGAYQHSTRVELSDHRTLEATLKFNEPWPMLKVVYRDPSMIDVREQLDVSEESNLKLAQVTNAPDEKHTDLTTFLNHFKRFWRRVIGTDFWLRPGPVAAIVSIVLVVALWLTRVSVPVVSASELLQRSAQAEDTIAKNLDTVLHRTINLEERRTNGGGLPIRRRIEVWQSAAREIKLRRIYDEQTSLIAGEWTKPDGTSTVYHRGSEPQSRTAPYFSGQAVLETGELWRLDLSPKDFNNLVQHSEAIIVDETSNTYVLSYQSDSRRSDSKLINAKLTLNKTDLHATEQTITVQRNGEVREYVFTETFFEQKPSVNIAPELFQPEPELLATSPLTKSGVDKVSQSADLLNGNHNAAKPVASAELEIEVTYLLNQIKANLGEQVSLTRTTGGMLRVDALAETETRKAEILRALTPVINNPAVSVEVRTVAEALERQRRSAKPRELTVREVEVANNRIPADTEVRAYFSARLVGDEAIDDEIKRYVNRVLGHSRKALLQASALKRLVRQFSSEDIRTVTPEARSKWIAMISEHAKGYQREISALRQELRPVFNGPNTAAAETISETNFAQLADRLLQLSYANDEAVRSAFTVSADHRTSGAIKSGQFWRSVASAEQLAAAIQKRYQQ